MRTINDFEKIIRNIRSLNGNSALYGRLSYQKKKVLPGDDSSKSKYEHRHFLKRYNGRDNTPAREVALMEFFRLMVPRQPKTRYYQEILNGKKMEYVQSKEILNHKEYQDNPDGKGAMEIHFFGCLVLKDGDHVKHNLLEDNEGWVYRIDGGQAGHFHGVTFDRIHRKTEDEKELLGDDMSSAVLKFLVCTDSLIDAWANAYDRTDTIYMTSERTEYPTIKNDALALKRIRQDMTAFFLDYPDFRAFLLSEKGQLIYDEHKAHVKAFCTQGKNRLVTNDLIFDDMDSRFMFLKKLAQMHEYTEAALIDRTSRQAQAEYDLKSLIKHSTQMQEQLHSLSETYPNKDRRTHRDTPLNTPMGALIGELLDETNRYIRKLDACRESTSVDLMSHEALNQDYLQFNQNMKNILNDQTYAVLKEPNSVFYSISCGCVFIVRSFFRVFDVLFHCGNTLNGRPGYRPTFFYPQSSLKPVVDTLTSEIENQWMAGN